LVEFDRSSQSFVFCSRRNECLEKSLRFCGKNDYLSSSQFWKGMNIVLGVTGGIALFKAIEFSQLSITKAE
jgi:hypothetical protein